MSHSHDHDGSGSHAGSAHIDSHGIDAHTHGGPAFESQGTDLLDLDGQVLRDYWDAALDLVTAAFSDAPAAVTDAPARVVDLGAGTGTGALGLARRLPGAEVVAVDVSESSLARVAAKAQAAGVGDRVRTLEVDLDVGWPALAPSTSRGRRCRCTTSPTRLARSRSSVGSPAPGGWSPWRSSTSRCASCPRTLASADPASRPGRSPHSP